MLTSNFSSEIPKDTNREVKTAVQRSDTEIQEISTGTT
jgi:hypothetical protein